jgi:hypothetical protein
MLIPQNQSGLRFAPQERTYRAIPDNRKLLCGGRKAAAAENYYLVR